MKPLFICCLAVLLASAPLSAQDIPLSQILVAKESWREDFKATVPVAYVDGQRNGSVRLFAGRVIGEIDTDGKFKAIINKPDFGSYRVAVSSTSHFYGIENDKKQVAVEVGKKTVTPLLKGFGEATALKLWPDEGHLVVAEADSAYLWAVRIEKDGSFGPGDRYYSLRTTPEQKMHVAAMTMDAKYLLYACTPLGIQVFDPTGRLSGVIAPPSKEPMTAITIGGAKADRLYVACGAKIYSRPIQGKAAYTLKKQP